MAYPGGMRKCCVVRTIVIFPAPYATASSVGALFSCHRMTCKCEDTPVCARDRVPSAS